MAQVEVLLAVDGSESAKKAEIAALKITKSYNIRMAALYVVNVPSTSEQAELIKFGEKVLDEVAEDGKKIGIEVQKILKLGSPADTILNVAKSLNVHTIVMGSEGKKGLKRVLLGSVAENVVRNAQCSVLVAR
ncbi:Putative universal stress protein [Methanosarcinales archaeon]|nr:universal stress protein [Candidatus Methanoperedens sp. BLZ2]KAB2946017.1 MAG: universal stress protein [Candidatus Methanoperedens sp.]MBZ0175253.1 universal stress protein [Candidatus Methanoperedens nitroreducens]CAG0965421.1 Putative universal stress protein [Methanosarcinales archaeon]MCX9076527.1 universal stress protein [Candidatus Methanoperedens sp.]MCX9088537.1 universal stress protein [Candidatus Methanoperedens sp.]